MLTKEQIQIRDEAYETIKRRFSEDPESLSPEEKTLLFIFSLSRFIELNSTLSH
jgi:hypothetical protein